MVTKYWDLGKQHALVWNFQAFWHSTVKNKAPQRNLIWSSRFYSTRASWKTWEWDKTNFIKTVIPHNRQTVFLLHGGGNIAHLKSTQVKGMLVEWPHVRAALLQTQHEIAAGDSQQTHNTMQSLPRISTSRLLPPWSFWAYHLPQSSHCSLQVSLSGQPTALGFRLQEGMIPELVKSVQLPARGFTGLSRPLGPLVRGQAEQTNQKPTHASALFWRRDRNKVRLHFTEQPSLPSILTIHF